MNCTTFDGRRAQVSTIEELRQLVSAEALPPDGFHVACVFDYRQARVVGYGNNYEAHVATLPRGIIDQIDLAERIGATPDNHQVIVVVNRSLGRIEWMVAWFHDLHVIVSHKLNCLNIGDG